LTIFEDPAVGAAVTQLAVAVVVAVIAALGRTVNKLLEAKASVAQRELLGTLASAAVVYVEAIGATKTGQEKLGIAARQLRASLDARGVKGIEVQEIVVALEQALHQQWFGPLVTKTPAIRKGL